MELNAVESLVQALAPEPVNTNNAYSAIVSHVDSDGTVWVNVAGSNVETPTESTSSEVSQGDAVTVEWRGNKLYIAGNPSNPAVGDARVTQVERNTSTALETAQTAIDDAAEAHEAATKYITYIDEEHGIRVFDGRTVNKNVNFSQINSDGMQVYVGGVEDSDMVASFGNVVSVGKYTDAHIEVTGDAISAISANGNEYFEVSDNGGASEAITTTKIPAASYYGGTSTRSNTKSLSMIQAQIRPTWDTILNGEYFAVQPRVYIRKDGRDVVAGASFRFTKGTTGEQTYTRNIFTVTYTAPMTIEITCNLALNSKYLNCYIVRGEAYLGVYRLTNGAFYRFGRDVAESGNAYAFLTGHGTQATSDYQLVVGKYNDSTEGALVVGNGGGDNYRSNAFTVDWNGNVNIPAGGKYKIDGVEIPYITAEGTNGNWSYRKWSSGKIELWLHEVDATLDITSANGNLYQSPSTITRNFPSSVTLNSVLHSNVNIKNSNYSVWASTWNCSTTTIYFRAMSAISRASAAGYIIDAYIIGRGN